MSTNNNSNSNNKGNSNPNNKGLGWIPDYPDLRDYRLGSGDINDPTTGRLKREDRSKEVEQIAQEFTNFVEDFSTLLDKLAGSRSKATEELAKQATSFKTQLGNRINGIQLSIFGDISFESVNIYRQLRQGVESKTPFSSNTEFSYESDVEKRILELKSCLYFIFQDFLTKELPVDTSPSQGISEDILEKIHKTKKSLETLKNRGKALQWLKENSFNADTYWLVQLFQYCTDIWIDGIVGLETYTTLNEYLEYLSDPKNFSNCRQFKDSEQLKNFENFENKFKDYFDPENYRLYPSDAYQPKSHLLPVSLLLPEEVFKRILSQLESWAIEEISKGNDIFEEEYLKKLSIDPKIFKKLFEGKIDSSNNWKEWIEELSNTLFEARSCSVQGKIEKSNFTDILKKEFPLVEPIVAVIIKILTPLAKFRDDPLETVVSEGLTRFEQLLTPSGPSSEERSSRRREFTKLVSQALERVKVIFDDEIRIQFKTREKSRGTSDSYTDATLYFYFLIKKLIRRFYPDSSSGKTNSSESQPNPFEKQEIFEITERCSSERMRFFRIPNLQIPLRRKTLEFLALTHSVPTKSSSVKQYLFLPGVVDLSYWCSEIEDQGSLNSCTALAGVALLEYFMNRSNGQYTDASSLFLYKATRELMNLKGDVGASVRETMKAMALFGIPPEQYWQYNEAKVNEEPPSFCYSFAQNYQALKYFRLDYAGISKEVLLVQIKAVIATGLPCIFGFTIYTSAYEASNQRNGSIPFPDYKKDRVVGGHAVVAVGYDDYKEIERKDRPDPSKGAFLIRNSFGDDWGDGGYGWLPYDYVLAGLTADWWSLLKAEWFSDDFWQGVRGNQGPVETKRQP
jgi:C1A family cysteine protease